MCVYVHGCVCVFILRQPHQSPSPWLIRCLSDGGPSRCLLPCSGPLERGANHFSGRTPAQPSAGPGQLGYTQDKRAGDPPASTSSHGERAGQTEEGGGGWAEAAVSILNNLLMGLPSISNSGCKVVSTVFSHVSAPLFKLELKPWEGSSAGS